MRRENWKGDYIDTIGRLRARLDQVTAARDEARLALGYARARVAELEAELAQLRERWERDAFELGLAISRGADAVHRAETAEAERDAANEHISAMGKRLVDVKRQLHEALERGRERKVKLEHTESRADRLAAAVEALGRCVERCKDRSDSDMVIFRDDLTLYQELDKMTAVLAGQKLSAREDPAPPAATVLSVEPCLSQQRIDGGPWEAQCVECGHPVCEHVRRAIIDGTEKCAAGHAVSVRAGCCHCAESTDGLICDTDKPMRVRICGDFRPKCETCAHFADLLSMDPPVNAGEFINEVRYKLHPDGTDGGDE